MSTDAAVIDLHPLVIEFFREVPERHLTLDEAADELGVARRTLDGWATGAVPQPRHRRAIAAWLERGAR